MGKRDLGGSQKLDFEMHIRHPVGHSLDSWRYDFGVRAQQATNLGGFSVCELRVRWCGVFVLKKTTFYKLSRTCWKICGQSEGKRAGTLDF